MTSPSPSRFPRIGLFGKYASATVQPLIEQLGKHLVQRGHAVVVEAATAEFADLTRWPTAPIDMIGGQIDLAVVIGGDGTVLHSARHLARFGVPLVGVNLGRLGFLTDIPTDSMLADIDQVLGGDYKIEERTLLDAEVIHNGQSLHRALALNDVVINKGQLARLIEFSTTIDGELVKSTRADGLIVATPTGSTAYALSAGGPILYPTLPAVVLVPICPHTLSDRPLVVACDSLVEITMISTSRQTAHVTLDGQSNFNLGDHDVVRVRRADQPVKLLHPSRRSHYEVLRAKLRWGEKF